MKLLSPHLLLDLRHRLYHCGFSTIYLDLNQAPIVNVVATILILLFIFPVWLSQRLSQDSFGGGRI
jgi:hypothetical protein